MRDGIQRCARLLVALAALPAGAAAQAPGARASAVGPDGAEIADPAVRPALEVASGVRGAAYEDGAVRAFGAAYRAILDGRGLTFTPVLGPGAPVSRHLLWHTVDVRRGGGALAFDAAVQPALCGLRAAYDRGAFREVYDVGADALKQSFVFDAIPAGEGDLVVRGRIGTTLAALPGDHAEELAFANPDGPGGVRIGAVVGVDARGERVVGRLAFDGEHLELRLPGAFVDRAVAPLVLDPPIAFLDIDEGADALDPDVAYDGTNDLYLFVWERRYSLGDVDVLGQRYDAAGDPVGVAIGIETSIPDIGTDPSVAGIAATDRFLVAWRQQASFGGQGDVRARSVDAGSGSTSAAIGIATTSANQRDLDVSGEATEVDDQGLVVWVSEEVGVDSLRIAVVDVPGAGAPSIHASGTLKNTSLPIEDPAICKTGGEDGYLLVVWEQFYTSPPPGDHDLFGFVIDRDANLWSGEFFLLGDVGPDEENPAVDGDGRRFRVVYEREDVSGSLANDLYCVDVEWDGALSLGAGGLIEEVGSPNDEVAPAVAWTGKGWMICWAEPSVFTPTEYQAWTGYYDAWSCQVCSPVVLGYGFGQGAHSATVVEAASRYHGTAEPDAGCAYVAVLIDHVTLEGDLKARLHEMDTGLSTDLGGGCGGGGEIPLPVCLDWDSDLRLVDATPFAWAWPVLSFDVLGAACGPCTLIANPFGGFVIGPILTDADGAAELAFPFHASPPVPAGLHFYAQWVVAGGASACAPIGADLSNAVELVTEDY